jgi:hypothetical protein
MRGGNPEPLLRGLNRRPPPGTCPVRQLRLGAFAPGGGHPRPRRDEAGAVEPACRASG